ncbi:hypothetical protein [Colwellia sp. MEBiC06753]
MRLSRAAWNNVIIFSVMGFILLINLTQPNKDEESATASYGLQSVLGEHAVILTMNIDQQLTIERVGQGWHVLPEPQISMQRVEQMMAAWQQLQGQQVDITIDRQQPGLFISMVLAGKQGIQLFSLYLVDQQLIIHNHQTNHYFALVEAMYKQLIPSGLLVE